MKVGIIGLGVVGTACAEGFKLVGHEVLIHDTKLNTSIDSVLASEVIYLCVPTPEHTDHSCDTSIVDSVVYNLKELNYQGVIAVKSTVEPGHTDHLIAQTGMPICFVPEFLRQRKAVEDFLNSNLLAVGTHSQEIFDIVCRSHGNLVKNSVMLLPTEAELLKYYSNTFNAARVVFANIMYELCQHFGANYDQVLDTFLLHGSSSPDYLDCHQNLRGFGGACLPKDTQALNAIIKRIGLDLTLFDSIMHDNQQFKVTLRDD